MDGAASTPLHLGLVVYGSLERCSGGNLYDRELVNELRWRGHRVDEVSFSEAGYPRRLLHNLSPPRLRQLAAPAFDVLLEDELVHPSLALLNRRLARRRPDLPRVAIVHHLRSNERHPRLLLPLYRWIERAFLGTVDAAVFNSHDTRRRVEGLLGREVRSVVATPGGDRLGAGSSRQLIAERARRSGPLRVVFVGNLIARKGLATLLGALARLEPWECVLEVIGDTTFDVAHAARMQRQVVALGLSQQVRFLGAVDDRTLAERFEAAQALAVPSSFEGFGIVYLEGMAFGLPVLATTSGAAAEIVDHGDTGFLVRPGDAAALAERLRSLSRDRELLTRMASAARRRFEGFPTWGQSAGAVADFLETLHDSRSSLGRRTAA